MIKKYAFTKRLWQNRLGATAIEYALIAAGISIVIVGALAIAGGSVTNVFNTVSTSL
ncbi:MAG: Flp family type IVb pilin [Rhodospirillaceae bacterium]|jgi:pilus assembly protein Flp/PilA|nr:Flp family type IVb pilin [Rhodospirillaceae bacterium]